MPPRRVASTPAATALAGLAAAAAAGVAAVYLLLVRTTEGRRLDDAAEGELREGSRAYEETSDLLDTISISSLALIGGAIMAVALLRRRPRLALGAGIVVLGANVTTQFLKATLERPGPAGPEAGSFPSGHVTVAMSLAMALVLVVPPSLRLAASLAGTAYAVGVGAAVIALDWHRPSDVVGAYLVSVGWAALVGAALAAAPGAGELRGRSRGSRHGAKAGAAAAAVIAGAFAAIVAVAWARLDVTELVDDRTAFVAASAACGVAGVALAALLAGLLQRASATAAAR